MISFWADVGLYIVEDIVWGAETLFKALAILKHAENPWELIVQGDGWTKEERLV